MSKGFENTGPFPIKIDLIQPFNKKRDDIQLLRAFSIICVLIYHLNSKWLPFGFLGVDIFFVISGFLMAFIIVTRKNTKMTFTLAIDFYYRRIKRIFPTYLISIIITLTFGSFFLYPLDRYPLENEAKYSLLFLLNLQTIWTNVDYFQLIELYNYMTHLWSLCVEIQFYLIVPPTFFLLFHMNQLLKVSFCVIVIAASFASQLFISDLYKHSFTPARIWQFFLGILSFYLQIQDRNIKVNKVIQVGSLPLILLGLTCLMFTQKEVIPIQIARLCCTLVAALILWFGNLLKLKVHEALIFIGDHSYTIYLVHWPIIIFYKYLTADEISLLIAIILTVSTIIISFLIDKSVEFMLKRMKSKFSLISFIILLYILAISLNYDIAKTGKSRFQISDTEMEEIRSVIDNFYGNQSLTLTNEQAYRYNSFLFPYDGKLKMCLDSRPINESMPETTLKQYICRIRKSVPLDGKNILIVGNSHAKSVFAGISYHFSDLFNRLELFAFQRCSPIYFRAENTTGTPECDMFIEEMHRIIKMMRWDIIFVIYKFPGNNQKFNQENDIMLNGMNQLYEIASMNANEIVFVPEVQIKPVTSPLEIAMQRLRVGKPVDNIFLDKNQIVKYLKEHQKRTKQAGCPKCVNIRWTDAKFCNKTRCQLVQPTSKLAYFVDDSHVSSIGSYYYGQMLRNKYDSYMKNKKLNLNEKQLISTSFNNMN